MEVKVISREQFEAITSRRLSPRDRELQECIEKLKSGKSVQITPSGKETARGLKASLTRRASAAGFKLEYKDLDRGFAVAKK